MVSETRQTSLSICREDVSLSDRDILSRYIGITDIPCSIQSPLRDDDIRPSFSIFERAGAIYWKDFGTGQSGSVVNLLAKLWGVTYKEALLKLRLDTEHRVPKFELVRRYKGKVHIIKNSTIKVKTRDWNELDRNYWASYGISERMCKWCNVYPISHALFTREDPDTGKKQTITVPMDKFAYAYFEWKDGVESIKLYQPYSTTMKWLSKHDSSVWDLWKQAFKWADTVSDETVIITSSRKDAMCLWESLNVPAMSLQGEGYIPKPQVMQQVMSRFRNVYLWYDNDFNHENDNPGQDNARKLCEMYPQLKNVCIPSEYWAKDPSDLYKLHGKRTLKRIWREQTKEK